MEPLIELAGSRHTATLLGRSSKQVLWLASDLGAECDGRTRQSEGDVQAVKLLTTSKGQSKAGVFGTFVLTCEFYTCSILYYSIFILSFMVLYMCRSFKTRGSCGIVLHNSRIKHGVYGLV